ncbi:gliding motility lipoprotein GldH [Algoriphagus litoralis]|uniref:gliding motility lipoprotein GldH n=1 Tax=Algoriphagus litoralis TaxID=2202829 RepID=UPI000DBABF18|nr:gliding motility lipoprotein GldH [Algoriphagus litoralis]
MSSKSFFAGLAMLLFISSCGGDRKYEEFHSFDSDSWHERDSVTFDLSSLKEKDGTSLIGIRFTESFPFSNCYIRVISEDSTGAVLDNKLINIPLFDSKSGRPKGSGFGNSYTFYDTLPFPMDKKVSKLVYLQYMRQENISGVEAVGLKIVK